VQSFRELAAKDDQAIRIGTSTIRKPWCLQAMSMSNSYS
jgi:hypothetical protein